MTMKITEWKEYTRGPYTYRIRANYGLKKIGQQEPYVSVTGETERRPARGGRWSEDSAGQLHTEVSKHFPALRDLIPWHLTSVKSGPMHYMANAKYWFDEGNVPHFKSTIIFGALPDDAAAFAALGGARGEWPAVEQWLKKRLPKMMTKLRAVLRKHGLS